MLIGRYNESDDHDGTVAGNHGRLSAEDRSAPLQRVDGAPTHRSSHDRPATGLEFARGGGPARVDRSRSGRRPPIRDEPQRNARSTQRIGRFEPGEQPQREALGLEISRPEEGVLDLLIEGLG